MTTRTSRPAERPVGSSAACEAASPVPPADGDGLDVGAPALDTADDHDVLHEAADRLNRAGFGGLSDRLRDVAQGEGTDVDATTPSFAHPVPLTAELLAVHGGTLPEGTCVVNGYGRGDVMMRWRDGEWHSSNKARVYSLVEITETGYWSVVHLPGGAA